MVIKFTTDTKTRPAAKHEKMVVDAFSVNDLFFLVRVTPPGMGAASSCHHYCNREHIRTVGQPVCKELKLHPAACGNDAGRGRYLRVQ